jgi:hypothetical protein
MNSIKERIDKVIGKTGTFKAPAHYVNEILTDMDDNVQ